MKPYLYKNMFSLEGKTAIVTGGLGILGKQICQGLAEFGANVAVIDLNQQEAEEFSKELSESFGVKCLGVACDVSSPTSVKEMVNEVVKTLGEIHVLHNNAASKSKDLDAFFSPFEEYSMDQWREIMSVNIDGMFLVAQSVGKQMVQQGKGGSIIQTASIYGIVAPDNRIYEGSHYLGRQINTPAVYSASKASVVGLTKYLASYWAPQEIRVNTLIPGGIQSGQNEVFIEKYSNRVPLGRMGRPDEIVGVMVYLASDASSYVTGQQFVIDGGLSAW
ncbi:SDR family oxidoreductase [Brevibacillus sp. FSL K6-0770]|uniref:SDR family oxidoreductase n=1 Tax=Brevibacillus TaxID=55080 RepID=UPI000ECD4886|nr:MULTISPECIES: SDR family oxidoreductase [Brevibacillus]MDH6350864.1 NAD(P)-dependent dehydrogenase (short-subunit alcohol dehydrogenase family) [Brevibacillus sp. 1238]MDR4997938.1 SDR family oxidoreductase [Brevibacillus parabrevis]NRQ53480.1 SDR family oxidoreductase [Brevibacillus sp. HD1.4A]HBZ81744.1 short-chain dehydrogenase [Brevibacillus sp.]